MNSYDLLIQFLGILTGLGIICFAALFFWLNNQVQPPASVDRRQIDIEVGIERRQGERRQRDRSRVYLEWST